MIAYLESSAAAKLIAAEQETSALESFLDGLGHDDLVVSSSLMETELRRMATRKGLAQSQVTDVLAGTRLLEATQMLFHEAGLLPGRDLRNLDALHVTTAIFVGADLVVSYDQRLIAAARGVGLRVVSPT